MAQAVKCPVCGGVGCVYGGFETGTMPQQTCHGCDGKGWVEVGCVEEYPIDYGNTTLVLEPSG